MVTKKDLFASRVDHIKALLSSKLSGENAEQLAEQLIKGTDGGGELEDFQNWLDSRFIPQLIWLDNVDYTRAITRSLPQALSFAATDFGGSRQRDLGQLWTDTARGLLGELAFQRFLKERFQLEIQHDISMDKTREEYISTDIKGTRDTRTGQMRPPKINVSVKTGKFNARWMDEYTASKLEKIDVLVFVRVGTSREHFVAFLKTISFLGSKLFPEAVKIGELNEETRKKLWDSIPDFEPIPAYITGYLKLKELNLPVHRLAVEVRGRKKKQIMITQGVGIFTEGVLRQRNEVVSLGQYRNLPLVVAGMGSPVEEKQHFYASTGALTFGRSNWHKFIELL